MDRKELQRSRVIGYLVDAVKTIIREEGPEAVTVRKVAQVAGYSYATMYNYFTDLNDLLWKVIADYLDELIVHMDRAERDCLAAGLTGAGLFKQLYRAYVSFYLQNPAVYRFAFFERLGNPPADVAGKLQTPTMTEKQAAILMDAANSGFLKPEGIQPVGKLLTGYVHGLMLFYFSGRLQLNEEELLASLDQGIDYLLPH